MTNLVFLLVLCLLLLGSRYESSSYAQRQFILEFEERLSFQDAEASCVRKFGTNLATVQTLDDQKNLERLFGMLDVGDEGRGAWIGLNDIENERDVNKFGWSFTSGQSQVEEFFNPNQPNDLRGQDCVQVTSDNTPKPNLGLQFAWVDESCSTRRNYACDEMPNPRYILITNQSLSFSEAQNFCRNSFGTNLATVRSLKENNHLRRIQGNRDVWIGLNDIVTEGNFVWASGLQVTFLHFEEGQPNNISGENCVLSASRFQNISNGFWNDFPCENAKSFVCDGDLNALGVFNIDPTNSPNKNDLPPDDESSLTIIVGASIGCVFVVGGVMIFTVMRIRSRRRSLLMNSKSPMSTDFDRIEAGESMSERKTFRNYMAGIIPTHYFHQSGFTQRNNLTPYKSQMDSAPKLYIDPSQHRLQQQEFEQY